jgi:hypothetical protein
MQRIDKTNPTSLRAEAQRLRAYADRLTTEADRAADAAPGAYVTGGSGRSRSQNRATERALDKTIDSAVKSVAARKRADRLDAIAADLEAGGPEKRRRDRITARSVEKTETKVFRRALKTAPLEERLFVGGYPAGLVFADRAVERNSDYRLLGMLTYETLVLTFQPDCPPEWRAFIQGYCYPIQIDPARRNVGRSLTWSQYGSCVGKDLTDRLFLHHDRLWEVDGYFVIYRGTKYICYELGNRDKHEVCDERDLLPWINAYDATCAGLVISGPDGRTSPRLPQPSQP